MNQPIGALCYRVRQFFRALAARVSEEELEQVAYMLTPASLALFRSMAIPDQRHGFDVCTALRQAGHTDPDLLAAALLHDVGKAAARLPAWQRAIIVLLDRFAPRLLARLSQGEPDDHTLSGSTARLSVRLSAHTEGSPKSELTAVLTKGWRRPFVTYARHPEMGARWAQEAGCSPLTVTLIRRHQKRVVTCQTEEDQLLAALQAADSLN